MNVQVTLIGFGEGNASKEQMCSLDAPATIADLMVFLNIQPHEAMLAFVGNTLVQVQTPLHEGDSVHFMAYLCGG